MQRSLTDQSKATVIITSPLSLRFTGICFYTPVNMLISHLASFDAPYSLSALSVVSARHLDPACLQTALSRRALANLRQLLHDHPTSSQVWTRLPSQDDLFIARVKYK